MFSIQSSHQSHATQQPIRTPADALSSCFALFKLKELECGRASVQEATGTWHIKSPAARSSTNSLLPQSLHFCSYLERCAMHRMRYSGTVQLCLHLRSPETVQADLKGTICTAHASRSILLSKTFCNYSCGGPCGARANHREANQGTTLIGLICQLYKLNPKGQSLGFW